MSDERNQAMSNKHSLLTFSLLITLSLPFPVNLFAQERLRKKVVEYGWDVPYPDFVQQNIREMEKRPFDGIIFRTKEYNHAFDIRLWKQADLQPQLDILHKSNGRNSRTIF